MVRRRHRAADTEDQTQIGDGTRKKKQQPPESLEILEIRNVFKDAGFSVDIETGQGDLSTLVGLNIPKYTVAQ